METFFINIFAKTAVILVCLLYLVFSFLLFQKESYMRRHLDNGAGKFIHSLCLVNLVVSLGLMVMAVLVSP